MASRRIPRRAFLKTAGAAAIGAAFTRPFAIGSARASETGRVVILGFDGVEPEVVDAMLEAGQLPNLASLRDGGVYRRLRTTAPPQSPVAWTSFATANGPGKHGVYDFIARNPRGSRGPVPTKGTGSFTPAKLSPDGAVLEPPYAASERRGMPFWKAADAQGLRCKLLNVPFAFPPDPLENGFMLCGLGVPDLRGNDNTFFSLSDAFTPAELGENLAGGQRLRLDFAGSKRATVRIPGPRDQRHGFRDPGAYATADLVIEADRTAGEGVARAGNASVKLTPGAWSDWLELNFVLSPAYTVRGIARFYPLEIGERVRVYMSAVQFHPGAPYVPFGAPGDYTAELADRHGLYKTLGWAYDTHALRQDALTEDAFLDDVRRGMAWRARLTLDELERGNLDLLVSCWTATDRVGHMFWRYRDEKHPLYDPAGAAKYGKALEETYRIMDGIVGEVAAKLNENDLLMVLSDHGFDTWRRSFNLNTWLREQGYLAVADPAAAERGFLLGLDWPNTRAYAVGLSSLYLNRAGRETNGVVPAGEAAAVAAELRARLLDVKDPGTGANVFSAIETRERFDGEPVGNAPDLVLGYAAGCQTAKDCVKGGVGQSVFEPNRDKWSGEHAAADASRRPGIFFASRPVESETPDIRDLGPTALAALGREPMPGVEGTPLR